ncbi:hypothetical protein WMY93_011630 [Mugilogobius chulae]|uniref:L1 transposable element RRM domain-containing protein n=1 Tax=Mugilogobius chulae TaxID=88201 RepID=A0AAW0PD68_9GOBI
MTTTQKKRVQTRLPTVAIGEANSANPASQEETQKTDINGLFAEIAKVGATLDGVASDVTLIKADTTELKDSVSAIQTRLTEAESRISDVEDQVAILAKDNGKLIKKVDQLWTRMDDQENRARRKNIRLVGLKEGKETGGALSDYVQKILSDGLGLTGGEYEIERCHRSLGRRPGPTQPPRIILVRFLRYDEGARSTAQTILPRDEALWQRQVKHTLAHPATLRFTWRGKRLSFTDVREAERFVREKIEKATDGEDSEDSAGPAN